MKKDISGELTVFVINSGFHPSYKLCLDALNNQSVSFNIEYIIDYHPMSVAFQEMLKRCKTKYFIECDGDMVLKVNSVEKMYNDIKETGEMEAMIAYQLNDVHLDFLIYGTKIYKFDVFKKYPYDLKHPSCEVDQLDRMKKDGYTYILDKAVVGEHSPVWSDNLIFERYLNLMEKYKQFNYYWLQELPTKLLNIFRNNPSELNLYALLGAYTSIISEKKVLTGEKDFRNYRRKEIEKMREYLEKPTQCTLYMTNKCNFKCKYCLRQHKEIEESPDMNIAVLNNLFGAFPTIKGACICFTGDTMVKLVNGEHKTFEKLVEDWKKNKKPFEVYSRNKVGQIVPGIAYEPRQTDVVNELVEITLDNGCVIRSTKDHYYMVKGRNKYDNRVKFFNGLPYIKAIDLIDDDSLMPLYTHIYNDHEYISDDYYRGTTHRLFAKHHHIDLFDKVVHHKDLNPFNNTNENLELLNKNEHIKLHANLPRRKERFKKIRDCWNESERGKQRLLKHNRSENIREHNSKRLKLWKRTEKGIKQTYDNLKKINGDRNIILKNNQNPLNILRRKQGSIIKILKKVIAANMPINEINYNKFWTNGYVKFNKIEKYFGNVKNAVSIVTYNHKIIKKKLIKLKKHIPVYCLTVKEHGNFALSSGVFVKNCGFGDPLMSNDLPWIIENLKKRDKYIGLITNGSLIKSKIEMLKTYPPNYISVSLNAANAEQHEEITGTKMFNDVIEGIKLLIDNKFLVYVSYICTKENWKHVPDFLKLVKSLGVEIVHLHNLLPHFDDSENMNFWKMVLTKDDEDLIKIAKELPESDIVKRWPVLIKKGETRRNCFFPWRSVAVNGNGSISLCNSVAPPKKENGIVNGIYTNVWYNKYAEDLRDGIINKQKDMCKKCFRNWECD